LEKEEATRQKRKRRIPNLELVSTFKKFMDNLEHKFWPAGPPGETTFQPPHMGKMKTREELVELKTFVIARIKSKALIMLQQPKTTD
jgi:hypothetical protein